MRPIPGIMVACTVVLAAACGGQAMEGSDDESSADSGAVEGGGAGTGGDQAIDAGGDAGASGAAGQADAGGWGGADAGAGGSPACGDGACPAHMACVGEQSPWCMPDADEDGVLDGEDNCPYFYNPTQSDGDDDDMGDACDLCDSFESCGPECCGDPDGDGIAGVTAHAGMSTGADNCPYLANPDQLDTDEDGIGDACDLCPTEYNPLTPCGDPCLDSDGDGIADQHFCDPPEIDGCPYTPSNPPEDYDGDGKPDVCDPDGVPPSEGASARAEERVKRRMAVLDRLAREGVLDQDTVGIVRRGKA